MKKLLVLTGICMIGISTFLFAGRKNVLIMFAIQNRSNSEEVNQPRHPEATSPQQDKTAIYVPEHVLVTHVLPFVAEGSFYKVPPTSKADIPSLQRSIYIPDDHIPYLKCVGAVTDAVSHLPPLSSSNFFPDPITGRYNTHYYMTIKNKEKTIHRTSKWKTGYDDAEELPAENQHGELNKYGVYKKI